MPSPKTLSKSAVEIFKMPRKDINFFKTGQLYKLKYNDPYKFKVRYSALDVKQIDSVKLGNDKRTLPTTFSTQLVKKFNVGFVIEPTTQLYNSFLLNNTFICLEANATMLRNFRSVIEGRNVDVCIFKQVPVFLFHNIKDHKPIIGSIQIDLNKQNLDELFGEQKDEVVTAENLVYIENFFEEVN